MSGNPRNIALEPAAQAFVDATSEPPFLYRLPPEEGRKAVDQVQDAEIFKPEIDEEWVDVPAGPTGTVRVRIVRPAGSGGTQLPVILYVHGAGWVFGDAHTHDRLVRDLAVGVNAAVVFPEYDRAPEAGYPVALEQSYAAARWVTTDGSPRNLDAQRLAVAGDSVGGNMAIALTLLAKERGDVRFVKQVEFYPVTDAAFGTASYQEFAEGYFLARDGMKWFWDQYTTSEEERGRITVSPLRADLEDLKGLPPALIITAEADVLRDEGEAFAAKLRRAGVPATNARFGGIVHDFVMVNALHDTEAAKHAVLLAVASLKQALHPVV
ncbi:alpha/beta hydrolase [Actinacidiphila acididurans]|uniref:Alpha/beta hydrolase n=1 Tax=Actinacidiphila acididurans TaxID=2784346 RepID=A0ABS2TU53_9ACTN|nr:alpha/beta hydrolase [Actinacidiphila acididurans]MBM9506864.1 alpha/beta hydrolase [Actinacidiphila acididurans]